MAILLISDESNISNITAKKKNAKTSIKFVEQKFFTKDCCSYSDKFLSPGFELSRFVFYLLKYKTDKCCFDSFKIPYY